MPEGAEALGSPAERLEGPPEAETLDLVPAGEAASESREPVVRNLTGTVDTILGLAYMSAVAATSEYSGYTDSLPDAPRFVASSCAHPVLGYVGAFAADMVFYKASKRVRTAAKFVAATLADLAAETGQSILIASPQYVDFMSSRNLPETAKDYAFSLLGMSLYMLQQRRSRKRQEI